MGTAASAFGWGDAGHETIGAIADQLIKGTAAERHVRALLGEETLETASLWADQIKYRTNQWPEAVRFRVANTNHFAMHFADIPFEEATYRDDSIGARPDDVVHAIPACILILEGKAGEQSVLKDVSPKIALRLLAHFIGDIHQPLHVGTGYLDGVRFVDPNGYSGRYIGDQGANRLVFGTNKLHFHWDITAVQSAMARAGADGPRQYAAWLLARTASWWQTAGPPLDWARQWADESLALSAKAHDVPVLSEDDSIIDRYTGRPRPQWRIRDLTPEYTAWSVNVTESQLAKAGCRLARTLEIIWPEGK